MPRRKSIPSVSTDRPSPPMAVTTRLFRSGNSSAIRLPKAFAESLQGALGPEGRVTLRRLAGGRLLIEPVRKRDWPAGFLASFGRSSPDFADAVAAGRVGPPGPVEEARAVRAFGDEGPAEP